MSENRNGYELRSDLLGMAIGILESRNDRQFNNECLKPEGQRSPVNPYATEDVLVVGVCSSLPALCDHFAGDTA